MAALKFVNIVVVSHSLISVFTENGLARDVNTWLLAHVKGGWDHKISSYSPNTYARLTSQIVFSFENASEALLFKLTWS